MNIKGCLLANSPSFPFPSVVGWDFDGNKKAGSFNEGLDKEQTLISISGKMSVCRSNYPEIKLPEILFSKKIQPIKYCKITSDGRRLLISKNQDTNNEFGKTQQSLFVYDIHDKSLCPILLQTQFQTTMISNSDLNHNFVAVVKDSNDNNNLCFCIINMDTKKTNLYNCPYKPNWLHFVNRNEIFYICFCDMTDASYYLLEPNSGEIRPLDIIQPLSYIGAPIVFNFQLTKGVSCFQTQTTTTIYLIDIVNNIKKVVLSIKEKVKVSPYNLAIWDPTDRFVAINIRSSELGGDLSGIWVLDSDTDEIERVVEINELVYLSWSSDTINELWEM